MVPQKLCLHRHTPCYTQKSYLDSSDDAFAYMNEFVVKAWQENFKQLVQKEHTGKDDYEYNNRRGGEYPTTLWSVLQRFPKVVTFVMTNVWFHC